MSVEVLNHVGDTAEEDRTVPGDALEILAGDFGKRNLLGKSLGRIRPLGPM